MKFKENNRTHQFGKDKDKLILVLNIKSKEAISEKVKDFFNECYSFLENLVGKVNEIQETFNNFKEKMFNFCDKNINRRYEKSEKDKADDFELEL